MKTLKKRAGKFTVVLMAIIFMLSTVYVGDGYSQGRSTNNSYGNIKRSVEFSPGYINVAIERTRYLIEENEKKKKASLLEKITKFLKTRSDRNKTALKRRSPRKVMPDLKKKASQAPQGLRIVGRRQPQLPQGLRILKQEQPQPPQGVRIVEQEKPKAPQGIRIVGQGEKATFLGSISYESLGLTGKDDVTFVYDGKNRLKSVKDLNGCHVLEVKYADNGHVEMVFDKRNHRAIEYATEDTYRYFENYIKYVGGYIKYSYAKKRCTAHNMLGKVINVYMTDGNGKILTGRDIVTTFIYSYWNRYTRRWYRREYKYPGFIYMADKSPLVPWHSGARPFVSDSYYGGGIHLKDQVKAQEYRYNEDGSLKNIRYNAWTAGLMNGRSEPGQYAYRIDTFDKSGKRTRTWYNDPIPTRYEPVFSGKVKKDNYGNYYLEVKKAFDAKGCNVTKDFKGKVFLLTTRYTDTTATNHGGQPGFNRFCDQKLETAYEGGAAKFTALNWEKLVNRKITVQGHLMTNPVSETGIYYKGKKVGVFSAFDVL